MAEFARILPTGQYAPDRIGICSVGCGLHRNIPGRFAFDTFTFLGFARSSHNGGPRANDKPLPTSGLEEADHQIEFRQWDS